MCQRRSRAPADSSTSAQPSPSSGSATSTRRSLRRGRARLGAGGRVARARGEVRRLSLRPSSRTHMGAVADTMTLCARLNAVSGPGEIVVSNLLYQALPDTKRAAFTELDPVEAKNIGR